MSAIHGPRVSPTLDLNFARNKSLVDTMTGRNLISFSRVQSGTSKSSYFGADGLLKYADSNEPRFDHDPTTGESLGLLIEESRDNILTYSEMFNDTSWLRYSNSTGGGGGVTIEPNFGTAPNGTYTASRLTFNPNDGTQFYKQGIGVAGVTYTLSFWIRADSSANFTLFFYDNVSGFQSETFSATTEWQRFTLTKTYGAGAADRRIGIQDATTGSIYLWGAQVEQGSFPTSYIPTPATFVSRADSTQGASYYDANGIIQYTALGAARDNAYFPDENGVMRPAGLLLEAAATNIHVGSTTDALTAFTGLRQGSASTVDPTGAVSTIETWTVDNSTGEHDGYRFYNNTYVNHVYSLFVKSKGITRIQVSAAQRDNGGYIEVDLANGSIISQTDSYATAQKLANGWVRISSTTGSRLHGAGFWLLDASGNRSFTGDGTSGVYVWGMQVEQSTLTYPTSYIPTDGTPGGLTRAADVSTSPAGGVTRTADTVSITGTNFSSWYNGDFGTFLIDMKRPPYFTLGAFMEIFDNAGPFLQDVGSNFVVRIGAENNFYTLGAYGTEENYKIGISYLSATSYSASSNGSVPTLLSTAIDFTNATEWHIGRGNNAFATHWRNGSTTAHWKRLTYYPERLPDSQLQKLTR